MRVPSEDGSMSTVSKVGEKAAGAAVFEPGFCAGIAKEAYSSCPAAWARRITGLAAAEDGLRDEEDGEELELGLSLGARRSTVNGSAAANAPWGEHCRILTARGFPSSIAASRGSPVSSSSSSGSSSPSPGGGGRGGEGRGGGSGVTGTKRAVDSVAPEVGSHSPSQVVGWPPVRAYRMNSLMNHSKENSNDYNNNSENQRKATGLTDNIHHSSVKDNIAGRGPEKKGCVGGSLFVKVKMDGMPIGRKVDLNAHSTYETLALALEDMFQELGSLNKPLRNAKALNLLDGSSKFVLTYEDKDGDWLLVGDVPWGMFLSTVKRLRIMRTSGAKGLPTRCQSSKIGG